MTQLMKTVVRFLASDDGTTAVAYAAIFLLLVLAALTTITVIGQATARGPEAF
jgi:Flp pilus assembly pilin Flp